MPLVHLSEPSASNCSDMFDEVLLSQRRGGGEEYVPPGIPRIENDLPLVRDMVALIAGDVSTIR